MWILSRLRRRSRIHVAHKTRKTFKPTSSLHGHGEDGEKLSFEKTFQISVKNVDLNTGIRILRSLMDPFSVETITIRKRGGDRT